MGGAAVVIGGGLLGLEAAAGLAWRGMDVTVLHGNGWVMDRQLDEGAAALLQRRLRAQGIAVLTNAKTVAIEPDAVILADGQRIPARIVVMAVGIRPEAGLARAAGLAVNRGILVDDAMRTDDPAIWAVGECTEHAGQCVGLVAPSFAQGGGRRSLHPGAARLLRPRVGRRDAEGRRRRRLVGRRDRRRDGRRRGDRAR